METPPVTSPTTTKKEMSPKGKWQDIIRPISGVATLPVSFHFYDATSVEDDVKVKGDWGGPPVPLTPEISDPTFSHKPPSRVVYSRLFELPAGTYHYTFLLNGEEKIASNQRQVTVDGMVVNQTTIVKPEEERSQQAVRAPKQWQPKESGFLVNQFLTHGVHSNLKGQHEKEKVHPNVAMAGHDTERRLLLVMVGLPARGKSFISRRLRRFLTWLGYSSEVFNVGDYRRKLLGNHHDHSFFRNDNEEALKSREDMAQQALSDALNWIQEGGTCAIFDGTNSTNARRQRIKQAVEEREKTSGRSIKLIFIEVLSGDEKLIESNILSCKVSSPDYANVPPEQAVQDFRERISHYEAAYETITDKSLSYIKLIEVGQEVQTNRIFGFMPSKIVTFLMNMHIAPRPIYLSRHGESEANAAGVIGGDYPLTARGREYAVNLEAFIRDQEPQATEELCVWTSTLRRSLETAQGLPSAQFVSWRALDEIDAGVWDGKTFAEFEETAPEEAAGRKKDKFKFRYQRGESYEDLCNRLEPVLFEINRTMMPVVIVGHQAVLRCILAYLEDHAPSDAPHLDFPLHTVLKIVPRAYGNETEWFPLGPQVLRSQLS